MQPFMHTKSHLDKQMHRVFADTTEACLSGEQLLLNSWPHRALHAPWLSLAHTPPALPTWVCGFVHFYRYTPVKLKYPINRFMRETKRQLDWLN